MKKAIPFFKKGSVITDICGVKQEIISFVAAMFPERVDYIGLHPMAGKEVGGFDNAEPRIVMDRPAYKKCR